MRVLIMVFGSRGDVQPVLALAVGLKAAGHEPTIVAPPNFGEWVESYGVRFISLGTDVQAAMAQFGFNIAKAMNALRNDVRLQFSLIDEARKSDVMVGAALVASGTTLSEATGVPYVFAMYSPHFLPSRFHCSPVVTRPIPRWANRLSWAFTQWFWNLLFLGLMNDERKALGLSPMKDLWMPLMTDHPMLVSDDALAPLPPDAPDGVVHIGPWVLPEPDALDAGLEEFLAAGEPPVYVGFGSMPDEHPEKTARMIAEAVEGAGVRALISSGWAKLGAEKLPTTVRVIGPAPHSKLFPRCSVIVHHGGAGTTSTAARAGVPQIVVPHAFDQYQWAAWAKAAGVAHEPIIRPKLTAERLEAAIRKTHSDVAMRDRARELTKRLTYDGVERAIAHLESVVAEARTKKKAA